MCYEIIDWADYEVMIRLIRSGIPELGNIRIPRQVPGIPLDQLLFGYDVARRVTGEKGAA